MNVHFFSFSGVVLHLPYAQQPISVMFSGWIDFVVPFKTGVLPFSEKSAYPCVHAGAYLDRTDEHV